MLSVADTHYVAATSASGVPQALRPRTIGAVHPTSYTQITRVSVKCGIAECGMRKVKCGTDRAEKYRGMVCNLRNAENHYHSQN